MRYRAILSQIKAFLDDERGIAAAALAAIPAIAGALGGSGGSSSGGGGGGLLGSLFNIGSAVTGLFGGGPESEILKTYEKHLNRAANRQDQLQRLVGPFNQLIFQNLEQQYGLRPQGEFDLGLLGIDVPGLESFVDPRNAQKVAKLQDRITRLEQKQGGKIASGKGIAKNRVKIQRLREQIQSLAQGAGVPEDVLQEAQRLQAGIRDPFDISHAAEQGALGNQALAVQRQIEESVPAGGLRDKLLADAMTQFGLQRGLLETQDDIFRRNFLAGFPDIVQNDYNAIIGGAPAAASAGLQGDLATLAGLQGAGQSLAGGVNGLQDFLSQFGNQGGPASVQDRIGIETDYINSLRPFLGSSSPSLVTSLR